MMMEEAKLGRMRVSRFLALVLLLLTVMLIGAVVAAQGRGAAAAPALGAAILIASFLTGTLLGFLFSVPRVLARDAPAGLATGQAEVGEMRRMLGTNTNLERISDWLTTLLVGAGLTQLGELGPGLASFAGFVRGAVAPMGPSAAMLPGLAPVLLVAGSVLGFLTMYLYTRIEIAQVLSDVEDGMALPRDVQRAFAGALRTDPPPGGGNGAAVTAPGGDVRTSTLGTLTPQDALDAMFGLLYQPDGYRRVIGLAEALVGSPLADRADFWFYAAAAYGQALSERRDAGDNVEAAAMRARALDAARRAVRINPVYKSRLRAIADPTGTDKDLAGLADDAAFKAIIG